jgi:cytoskeletal protein CcmA (bactofilin family)
VFGRSNQEQPPPPPVGNPANQSSPQPAQNDTTATLSAAAHSPAGTASVIGDDLAIVGEKITVVSQSSLHVDGVIQGDINGQEVVIGPNGKVTGTVTANVIKIEGEIQGALKGSSVALMPSARVDGDILHQKLAISEGAQFDGRVRRPKDPSEVTPNLDPSTLQGALRQD